MNETGLFSISKNNLQIIVFYVCLNLLFEKSLLLCWDFLPTEQQKHLLENVIVFLSQDGSNFCQYQFRLFKGIAPLILNRILYIRFSNQKKDIFKSKFKSKSIFIFFLFLFIAFFFVPFDAITLFNLSFNLNFLKS